MCVCSNFSFETVAFLREKSKIKLILELKVVLVWRESTSWQIGKPDLKQHELIHPTPGIERDSLAEQEGSTNTESGSNIFASWQLAPSRNRTQ